MKTLLNYSLLLSYTSRSRPLPNRLSLKPNVTYSRLTQQWLSVRCSSPVGNFSRMHVLQDPSSVRGRLGLAVIEPSSLLDETFIVPHYITYILKKRMGKYVFLKTI